MSKIKTFETTKTILTITVGFIVVFLITKTQVFLTIALVVGLIGMFSTFLSEKINFLWMKLTQLLSLIVPNILLSVVFYLFLFPMALLSRVFGKKNEAFSPIPGLVEGSMFEETNKEFTKESFENIW